jgi:FAD-dependent urate hydroxylase
VTRQLRHGDESDREPIPEIARYRRSTKLKPVPNGRSTRSLRILVVGAGVGGISIARGLLRDGHDVTVFERRPDVKPGGGAVTIWSNGATVLGQLGVDMDGAGQLLSTLRVMTSTGRPVATVDLTAIADRLGAPVRMVPRRVLLERLLEGFPNERIWCNARAVGVVTTQNGVRLDFEDGSWAEGDLLIGADGLHSMVRDIVGAQPAQPTGWCSWQGLVTLPHVVDKHVAQMFIGEKGNIGLWPAGGSDVQWWFDLPWSPDFVRPGCPIEMIRSNFKGWSDTVDRVLATLTDEDLASSPFPHFRHPIPRSGQGAVTLLGDAAHTMPPTLAQGTNQALLDTMVLCKALSDFGRGWQGVGSSNRDLSSALRWYENTRRRKVKAVSWVTTQQVSRSEAALRPAAMISDRFMTWALTTFLRSVSHRRISAEVSRDLGAATTTDLVHANE